MEDILVWIFWIIMIVGGIASYASKAIKKFKEAEGGRGQGRTNAGVPAGSGTGAGAGAGSGSGRKLIHKSLAEVLEELANQEKTKPSPVVAPRPVATPTADWPVFGKVVRPSAPPVTTSTTSTTSTTPSIQPAGESAAISHDYYSLESEYDAADGRGYRESYNAEMGSYSDDVSAYEGLAAERARRTTYSGTAAHTADAQSGTPIDPAASADDFVAIKADNARRRNTDNGNTLEEILDGEFDLRRAVIEAEILTPKYGAAAAKYF